MLLRVELLRSAFLASRPSVEYENRVSERDLMRARSPITRRFVGREPANGGRSASTGRSSPSGIEREYKSVAVPLMYFAHGVTRSLRDFKAEGRTAHGNDNVAKSLDL